MIKKPMILRKQELSVENNETFFLWGPRQTGKSTLLREIFPDAMWIDLLKSEEYRKFIQNPELLRELVAEAKSDQRVIIDEIQKVPTLLNEVHWLIENKGIAFGLCGSSARKVKRGHANLLGGRAIRFELFGFTSSELGAEFKLNQALNHGYIPKHYLSKSPKRLISSYLSDYLKEEIAAEGLVRNLPSFSEFLNISAFSDGEIVNYSTIARDCAVSSKTVKSYFEILEETLIASFLPAYKKRLKRRTIQSPKFYMFDVGLVNFLSKRGILEPGSEAFGKAFENWVYHELRSYVKYREIYEELSYWRLASGIEVDFIIGDFLCAIEAKSSQKIKSDHLKGLRSLDEEVRCKEKIVVCLEAQARRTDDGIRILPYHQFSQLLWSNQLF